MKTTKYILTESFGDMFGRFVDAAEGDDFVVLEFYDAAGDRGECLATLTLPGNIETNLAKILDLTDLWEDEGRLPVEKT